MHDDDSIDPRDSTVGSAKHDPKAAFERRLMQLEQAVNGLAERLDAGPDMLGRFTGPARPRERDLDVPAHRASEPMLGAPGSGVPPLGPEAGRFTEAVRTGARAIQLKAERPFRASPHDTDVIVTADGRKVLAVFTGSERAAILALLNGA